MPRAGAVAAGAQAEGAIRVDDQLDGLGAVGELHHRHDDEQRYDERRGARRAQPRRNVRPPRPGSRPRRPCAGRSVAKSSAETANVPAFTMNAAGAEATASRSAPIAGPITTAEVLHGVEQGVGGAEPTLPDQTRQQGHRRWPLRAPCRRRPAPTRPITSATGPSPATTAARTSMSTRRTRLPANRTVRRG